MMDNGEKDVVLYEGPATGAHPLARYGESDVVRALAKRLPLADHGKIKLLPHEYLLVATAAIAYQADPFVGEISWWVTGEGQYRKLTIFKGRDLKIRSAEENAREQGTYLLPPRFRFLSEDERLRMRIPDGALAIESFVQDYNSVQLYQATFNTLSDAAKQAALKGKELLAWVEERTGPPPGDVGVGVLTESEMKQLDSQVGGNKMPHVERCRKRAYTASLAKRWAIFNRPPAPAPMDTSKYIIEGDFKVLKPPTEDQMRQRGQRGSEALFGNVTWPEHPWAPEVCKKWIAHHVMRYEQEARSASEKQLTFLRVTLYNALGQGKEAEQAGHSFLAFVCGVDSSKTLTGPQILAVIDFMEPVEYEPGKWMIRPFAGGEISACVAARLKDLGQAEMPLAAPAGGSDGGQAEDREP